VRKLLAATHAGQGWNPARSILWKLHSKYTKKHLKRLER